jgi:ABC-2 type transport system permease protein
VSLRLFLWVKFFVYFLPLLVMTEILILASNLLLQVTPFMMVLSMVTMLCVTPGVVAMGIGLGAAYGDFHAENPAESVTSFGGLLYMILCVGFILLVVALEAGPVYTLFMAVIRGQGLTILQWIWLVGVFLPRGAPVPPDGGDIHALRGRPWG